MPIYFNDVAPFCPVSRDQPTGPGTAPTIRTAVPRAHDLPSAIAAVNILRSIVNQVVIDKVINNLSVRSSAQPPDQLVDKQKHTRWSEQKSRRVKRKYKYYSEDRNGVRDEDVYVTTERIERMVWYDSAWKTSLVFSYGDKGEGVPQGGNQGSGE